MPRGAAELKTAEGRMNEVGIPIRVRRRTLKIRQEDLAARIDLASGGTWQAGRRDIHRIEAGTRKVTDLELRIIARALDIQPCDLFT